MTVATDLQLPAGPHRAFFLRIDGYEPQIWAGQQHATETWPPDNSVTGWTRTALGGLEVPDTEWSDSIDLGTMATSFSAMTISLLDIRQSADQSKSHWGALFAPGNWQRAGNYKTGLKRPTEASTQLSATDATMFCDNNNDLSANFPSSGHAYIGQETFTYSSKGTSTGPAGETIGYLGAQRGKYSAFTDPRGAGNDRWATTYKYPDQPDLLANHVSGRQVISTVPMVWIGRWIALYCTTWDHVTNKWNVEADAALVWCGKIDSISYSPKEQKWKLACKSIIECLQEKEIGFGMPHCNIRLINLYCLRGRSVQFRFQDSVVSSTYSHRTTYTASQQTYDIAGLFGAINEHCSKRTNWSSALSAGSWFSCHRDKDGHTIISMRADAATAANTAYFVVTGDAARTGVHAELSHVLRAMGFDKNYYAVPFEAVDLEGDTIFVAVLRSERPCWHNYLPLLSQTEWAYVRRRGAEHFFTNQGDYTATRAWIVSDDAYIVDASTKSKFVLPYNAVADYAPAQPYCLNAEAGQKLTLDSVGVEDLVTYFPGLNEGSFLGSTSDEGITCRQAYVPAGVDGGTTDRQVKGPFQLLLYSLLSTGASTYNHATYDKLPVELGCAIPSQLVNINSFLAADAVASAYPSLYARPLYIIDEPTKWIDLFLREGSLFGFTLAWHKGQLKVKSPFFRELADAITLNESNTAARDDYAEISMSRDSVINQYRFNLGYDWATGDYYREVIVNDRESIEGIQTINTKTLEHPGVWAQGLGDTAADLVKQKVSVESFMTRLPWYVTTRTLNATLFNRVFVADIVALNVDRAFPDPFGSGAYSAATYAVVLDVSWNMRDQRGECTLLVFSRFDGLAFQPWAPAAALDITAGNAGWNATTNTLTLLAQEFCGGTYHDGATFAVGDKLLVAQRSPISATNPPANTVATKECTVLTAYNATTRKLEVNVSPPAGWDADLEYVVTFANYGSAATAQKTRGLWGAAKTTHLLNAADNPQRWG